MLIFIFLDIISLIILFQLIFTYEDFNVINRKIENFIFWLYEKINKQD